MLSPVAAYVLPVDLEREVAFERVEDLRRPRHVRLGPRARPRAQGASPRTRCGRLTAYQQAPAAAAGEVHQLRDIVAQDDTHAPLAPEFDELREADVERLRARRTRVASVGIDALLLDLDEHAAADAGSLREFVERQPALGAQTPQVPRHAAAVS